MTDTKTLRSSIVTDMEVVFKAEGTVHTKLNSIMLALLEYVTPGFQDKALFNELTVKRSKSNPTGLTRNNRAKVISFLRTFFESGYDETKGEFTGPIKGIKKVNKIRADREAFEQSGMDFWDWCELTGKDEDKPATDFGKRLGSALASALDDDKGGMDETQVIDIVLEHVAIDQLMYILKLDAIKAA